MDATLQRQIDKIATAAITGGITGVVVGITDPVHGDLLKAYGTADQAGTPMTTQLHYRIASVSKTFTAFAVLDLVDQHKVSLDDHISSYVADIPNGNIITIRDLLAMRSGLYDYAGDPGIFGAYTKNPLLPGYTLNTALAVLRANAAKCTAPDKKSVYTNSNYLLLGYVIAKVTGRPVPAYLDGVAARFGLSSTSFPTTADLPTPYAHGYTLSSDLHTRRDVTRSNPVYPWTAGALVSTVPDMLRYAAELGTGEGLSKSTFALRQQWTPLTPSGVRVQYGLGLLQIGDWIGHDGSIFGYSDVVAYLPSARASVVVMVNAADGNEVPSTAPWGQIVKLLYPNSLTTY